MKGIFICLITNIQTKLKYWFNHCFKTFLPSSSYYFYSKLFLFCGWLLTVLSISAHSSCSLESSCLSPSSTKATPRRKRHGIVSRDLRFQRMGYAFKPYFLLDLRYSKPVWPVPMFRNPSDTYKIEKEKLWDENCLFIDLPPKIHMICILFYHYQH